MRVFLLQASHLAGGYQMPLSLPSLGAYLRKQGHEVAAFDLKFPRHRAPGRYLRADMDVVGKIRAFRPDVLGISCSTVERHNARFWAGLMKECIPEVKIVVGGPHVSFTSRQVLEHWKPVDYVVRFEGEVAFANLLERLSDHGPVHDVPGISYRDADGQVHDTEESELIADLDSLPHPDRTIFPDANEMILGYEPIVVNDGPWLTGPTVHTMTSRGCPFLCRFCSTSHFWQGRTRFRSPENVVDELKQIKARWPAVSNLIFVDDSITIRRSHIQGICELMLREGLKFKWKSWSRLDILDKELLQLMKRAGCACVLCGVESGTEHGLELVGKKLNLEKLIENTKMIEEAGIGSFYYFIMGIPGETKEESLITMRLARQLESSHAMAKVFCGISIFPGTAYCADLEKDHGPIDWDHPAPSIRPMFGHDGLGNPVAPLLMFPSKVVSELEATLGLPSIKQFQQPAAADSDPGHFRLDRRHQVQCWSPYLLPQLKKMARILSSFSQGRLPKVLSVRGRSKESLLHISLTDCNATLEQLAIPEELLDGFPEFDYRIEDTFGKLPSGEFQWVIDLNSLSDLREEVRVRVISHLRRTLAPDGTAVFLYQNPDHLTMRASMILRTSKPLAAQRLPSAGAFRAMLKLSGFAVKTDRSAGIWLPSVVFEHLPPFLSAALGAIRMPRSLGVWSAIICRPAQG